MLLLSVNRSSMFAVVTAPSLPRAPVAAGTWTLTRLADLARQLAGALLVIAAGVTGVVAVPAGNFDPALPILLAVIVGGALGGVRGGLLAAGAALVVALFYYSQAPLVGSPGNAARVLMLLLTTLAGGWLVGSLRDVLDRLRPRAATYNRAAERIRTFSVTVADAADDALYATIVREGAALVGADMAVLTVIDPRSGRHVVCATRGTDPQAMGVEVLPGVGVTGEALRDQRMVVASGVEPEPALGLLDRLAAYLPSHRLRAARSAPSPTSAAGRPAAAVPCLHAGRVTATLTVGRRAARPFDSDDRLALSMAAPTIALTVANWLLRRQVRESTLRDPLTGLYNRSFLDAALDQLLALRRRIPPAERPPLSVILFDIDDFRGFNEAHGRKTGDAAVRAISALLRGRFRQSDLLARVSGDGFLVVLDGAPPEVCARLAAEIRAKVQGLALTDQRGAPVQVSLSAGCATFGEETDRADAIIRSVEAALDTARWSGPGAIVSI